MQCQEYPLCMRAFAYFGIISSYRSTTLGTLQLYLEQI